jgi:hypothetical protein
MVIVTTPFHILVNSVSIMVQGPGESSLARLVQLAHLGSGEKHFALLVDLRRVGLLRRWDDLLDEDVAAIFGLASGKAELLALSFHAWTFTPDRAASWLAERDFKPLLFVPNSGTLAAADFDAPLGAPVGLAVSGNGTNGEWRW